jgi:glycerol-3-phosphate dehydrogenase
MRKNSMTKTYDVIIIGAGVTGAAIARELSRHRLAVLVLEKEVDVSFGTSKANSGIIHAGFHESVDTLKGRLCVLGNPMFDRLREELDFPFERRGELMVAFDEEELRILHVHLERGRRNGVPDLELIGREQTLELEPNLNPDIVGALFARTAGVICPYQFCFSLIDNARENGVEVLTAHPVVRIGTPSPSLFEIETANGACFRARYVVNAAGLYADEIARLVGACEFRICPRKGEEYLLDRRVSQLVHRVIFPCPTKVSKGMLVIPTVDGPVMVGPTAEETDDKTNLGTTREGLQKVFGHAQHMVPAIRATDVITSFAGLRPAVEGGDFIIGPSAVPGFINVAGIQSPGLTASPAIAELVCRHLQEQGLQFEPNPGFNPHRRQVIRHAHPLIEERRYEELAGLIGEDRNYARLVCRCEGVTEAEVVAAIRQGHTTLDGIKFATRAGSGRCQGGFCTSRIMDILQRETGMSLASISKKGPGSEITPLRLEKGGVPW